MARVTNLHLSPQSPSSHRPIFTTVDDPLHHHYPREFYHQLNPFSFDFEIFSPPNRSSNPSFFDDYATSYDFGFDLNPNEETSETEPPNCFYIGGEDDEEEQMNFVTDLFESRPSSLPEDPIWERNIQAAQVPPPEFGFGPGLRVVDMDSESDSEEFEVTLNAELLHNDNDNYDNDNNSSISSISYRMNRNLYRTDEILREEWEEVGERLHSQDGEHLNSLIHRIEEISVSDSESANSTTPDEIYEEMELQSIDWEVLLAVNNLEMELQNLTESSSRSRAIETAPLNLEEDFEALFGALLDRENVGKGSPPAAISSVKSLVTVVMSKEDVSGKNGAGVLACAVCKDEFVVGDKATRMPCGHMYHGVCIFPWLKIRNTCPVCRHELPTDNPEYERKRRERHDLEIAARYHFQLLP